ncbi:tyrosine-type recombinase/integrase [Rosettibacter firmus]|uniref:tyrosine-type recombinase/integrase n=1 Tax=Rosettibacter firmus TaxID=3111522 RepID=UPI00336BE9B0
MLQIIKMGNSNKVWFYSSYNPTHVEKIKTVQKHRLHSEIKYVLFYKNGALKKIFWKEYWQNKLLFSSKGKEKHKTTRTIEKIFTKDWGSSEILTIAVHTLRHSFDTYFLEGNVNLRYIQNLLGHKSNKTAEIFLK